MTLKCEYYYLVLNFEFIIFLPSMGHDLGILVDRPSPRPGIDCYKSCRKQIV